jgi:hypothetical protein
MLHRRWRSVEASSTHQFPNMATQKFSENSWQLKERPEHLSQAEITKIFAYGQAECRRIFWDLPEGRLVDNCTNVGRHAEDIPCEQIELPSQEFTSNSLSLPRVILHGSMIGFSETQPFFHSTSVSGPLTEVEPLLPSSSREVEPLIPSDSVHVDLGHTHTVEPLLPSGPEFSSFYSADLRSCDNDSEATHLESFPSRPPVHKVEPPLPSSCRKVEPLLSSNSGHVDLGHLQSVEPLFPSDPEFSSFYSADLRSCDNDSQATHLEYSPSRPSILVNDTSPKDLGFFTRLSVASFSLWPIWNSSAAASPWSAWPNQGLSRFWYGPSGTMSVLWNTRRLT